MATQRDYRFEERAAIMEFDGEMTREEAERRAREDLEAMREERRRAQYKG